MPLLAVLVGRSKHWDGLILYVRTMPYIKYDANNNPIGYATSPPSSEVELWTEVIENSPDIAIAEAKLAAIAHWGGFRMTLLADPDFMALLGALMGLHPMRMLTFLIESGKDAPYAPYLITEWNDIISGYPGRADISSDAIARWNADAIAANVPLRWLQDASLEIE